MRGRTSLSVDVVLRRNTGVLPIGASCGWRSKLRPCAPALIALAVLVFLWGLGYKLSLYHNPRNNVSRVTVAKLWTGPRMARLVPPSAAGQMQHSPSGAHAFSAAAGAFPPLQVVAALRSCTVLQGSCARRSLIPPRSPPSPRAA